MIRLVIINKVNRLELSIFVSNFVTFQIFSKDVDRCHLERHLENSEFERILGMNRMDFYRLPEWKRNELKKRVKLF